MYSQHVPVIRSYCMESPENLASMVEFVLATIQQGLSTVPMILDDIRTNKDKSAFLFGSKRRGYRYLHDNKQVLFDSVSGCIDPVEAVSIFFQIDGIGAVKAGFCAQLLGFNTGCIDSHNLKLLGINPNAVSIPKSLKPATRVKRLHDYVDLTHEVGGAQYLWDSWCSHVAGNQANKSLTTGFDVSKLHVECIVR